MIIGGIVAIAAVAAVTAGVIWSGVYNVAADDDHTQAVSTLLQTVRERSIATRIDELQPPPDLADPARIRQGAGNYDAMCMGCHLAPGMGETELSRGLNPAPPNLSKAAVDATAAFWVIKHGIKATGMPAWGESMADEYVWNMAAFLQELPGLDAAQYDALVASSGGHDHGGGETMEHGHSENASADHHGAGTAHDEASQAAEGATDDHPHPPGVADDHHAAASNQTTTHRHADGTVESHPTPQSAPSPDPAAPEAGDGHDHQH
ncbi:MAG: cytochrome c [Proteobacteria bacterium]|nr:cytochrome c [Pseudomonadota bacterium]